MIFYTMRISRTRQFMIISFCAFTMISYSQSFNIIRDIPYVPSPESERQKLDLYTPESDHPMPCMVWIHGGAWIAGSKEGLPREMDILLERELSSRGVPAELHLLPGAGHGGSEFISPETKSLVLEFLVGIFNKQFPE